MKLNCLIFSSLYLCCILQLMLLSQGHGSLLPFSDRPLLPTDFLFDDLFDPFRILEQVPLALEREESMSMLPAAAAKVDWKETPESHVIKLDVPGLKKEELKIEVEENRVLLVTGERKREEDDDEKDHHWHRVERSYGKFWRRFRLPENVDLDRVVAKLENGVLVISMPKLSPDMIKGPKVVEIEGDHEANRQKISGVDEPKQEL